jgi:hypothetical protein
MGRKKHYIDALLDAAREAFEDGLFEERRTRLRDDVIGIIEREREGAVIELRGEMAALRRENGELRLAVRKLEEGE